MKILIAEDDLLLQMCDSGLMSIWGYDFDIASNGREAVEHAQKNEGEYDLCLMDIDMPIMDGLEATKIIRRKTKYFPIMALSGRSEYREKCLQIGMDDFLEKPCFPDDLLAKINELTVKSFKLEMKDTCIFLKKEMPMDAEHAKELRELEKRGLCKMSLRGALAEVTMVVHKNVPQKISHDFIGDDKQISIFIDRSDERPGECYLYRINFLLNTRFLSQEKLEEKIKAEDEYLEDCNTFAEKKKEV